MNTRYRAVCEDHGYYIADTGTPAIQFIFKTLYDIETPDIPVNKNLTGYLWLSDKPYERSVATLDVVFGWSGSCFSEINGTGVLVGTEVILVTEWEEYNGKRREKVAFINSVNSTSSRSMARLDDVEAAQLSERLRGQLMLYRQNNPPTAKTSAPVKAAPQTAPATATPKPFVAPVQSQPQMLPALSDYGTVGSIEHDDDLPF